MSGICESPAMLSWIENIFLLEIRAQSLPISRWFSAGWGMERIHRRPCKSTTNLRRPQGNHGDFGVTKSHDVKDVEHMDSCPMFADGVL